MSLHRFVFLCIVATAVATDHCDLEEDDFLALAQRSRAHQRRQHHRGRHPEDGFPKGEEFRDGQDVAASAWEQDTASHGLHVHRPGTAVLTGAVMYRTAFEIVADALTAEEQRRTRLREEGGEQEEEDRSNATELGNGTDLVSGFDLQFSEKAFTGGTYFISEMNPGCKKHGKYGDTDCRVKFDKKFTLHSTMVLNETLGAGARLYIDIHTHFDSFLIPDPEDLHHSCPVCGDDCKFNYMGKDIHMKNAPCPITPGPYTIFTDSLKVPDKFVLRTTTWKQNMDYKLKNDGGEDLVQSRLVIKTVS